MNFPTTTLKSGVRVMTRPVLTEELPPEFSNHQPPGQPAVFLSWQDCEKIAIRLGGRLPTEEEWLEAFEQHPYAGGILEWTNTCNQTYNKVCVMRGGSWGSSWCDDVSSCREWGHPYERGNLVGFRLAFDK